MSSTLSVKDFSMEFQEPRDSTGGPPRLAFNEASEPAVEWIALVIKLLREFIAVLVFLLCWSRIGPYVFDTTALAVFMTLVVFCLPLLTPYVVCFVNIALDSKPKVLTIVLRVAVQVAAAAAAAYFRLYLDSVFGREVFSSVAGPSALMLSKNDTALYHSMHELLKSEEISLLQAQCWWTFEEMFAVLFLLIGLVHIMESSKDSGFLSRVGTNVNNEGRTSFSIPTTAIFYISVLVAALRKLFPTAHLGFTVSLYLTFLQSQTPEKNGLETLYVDNDNAEVGFRLLGGVFGTFFACVYVWVMYWWAPDKEIRMLVFRV